jgi:hypothetical protein
MMNLSPVFFIGRDASARRRPDGRIGTFFLKSDLISKENGGKPALFLKKTAFLA